MSRRLILLKRQIPPTKILRNYIEKHPGHLPEALLCEGNCAELGSILRGEKDAVQVLFSGIGAELLDQFYGDGLFTSHWLAAIAAAVSTAARSLPEGRGLRILEIGAGTGGLASQVLPLLERGLHSYTFSDVSAAFFSGAAQKLAAFSEVEFKIFDLEKPGVEQELEAASIRLHHRDQRAARRPRCACRLAELAWTACTRRQPHFHGHGYAATLDRDRFRPNERLVAVH